MILNERLDEIYSIYMREVNLYTKCREPNSAECNSKFGKMHRHKLVLKPSNGEIIKGILLMALAVFKEAGWRLWHVIKLSYEKAD